MASRKRLNDQEIEQELKQLEGWGHQGGRLRREYKFADFARAWAFMSGAAIHAQGLNHHPDWSNSYSKVVVELSTHDAGGVTELDVEMARRMEALARAILSTDS